MNDPYEMRQICDEKVVEIVQDYARIIENSPHPHYPKLVLILRGLPGAGKTMFARCVELYATVVGLKVSRLSADDAFVNEHGFLFTRAALRGNHRRCFELFQQAVNGEPDVVIVDNTNVNESEYGRYEEFVRQNHVHHVISFTTYSERDAISLSRRSTHRIEDYVIVRRFRMYDQQNHAATRPRVWVNPRWFPAPGEVPDGE